MEILRRKRRKNANEKNSIHKNKNEQGEIIVAAGGGITFYIPHVYDVRARLLVLLILRGKGTKGLPRISLYAVPKSTYPHTGCRKEDIHHIQNTQSACRKRERESLTDIRGYIITEDRI